MHRYRALALVAGRAAGDGTLVRSLGGSRRRSRANGTSAKRRRAGSRSRCRLGFVAGTLLSATLNLPDVIRVRYLFAACAILGAVANALSPGFAASVSAAIALRFLTGVFLAGVYPPG
jgi:hypothetical protein